jgi:hypothetical protein
MWHIDLLLSSDFVNNRFWTLARWKCSHGNEYTCNIELLLETEFFLCGPCRVGALSLVVSSISQRTTV